MRRILGGGILRSLLVTAAAIVTVLALPAVGHATLQLAPGSPHSGNVGYSADGLGQNAAGGSLQAQVPVGSTVIQAWLHGTAVCCGGNAAQVINFDGTNHQLVLTPTQTGPPFFTSGNTARADVTNQVRAKVGTPAAPGGIYNFQVNNDPPGLDGVSLTVVYTNPTLPQGTVAVLDGGSSTAGDQVTFNFLAPINKGPGFQAIMSLGSGFSFQGGAATLHSCGSGQFSTVDINGQRLTTCAGHHDDGEGSDGALITVGGVGDLTDNPPNPNGPGGLDDELYDINPFIVNGDTQLIIRTTNPSNDDNLFLAVIQTTAQAAVTTEVCDNGRDDDGDGQVDNADPDCWTLTLSPSQATNTVGDPHTVTATLERSNGQPVAGQKIRFIVTGANSAAGSSNTNASGQTTFTYTGTNAGGDDITACADLNNNNTCESNEPTDQAEKTYVDGQPVDRRWMSGEGRLTNGGGKKLDYAYIIECNADKAPRFLGRMLNGSTQNLTVSDITAVSCTDDPSKTPAKAGVTFDTMEGTGTGKLGSTNVTVQFKFVDGGGPPDSNDSAYIKITNTSTSAVLFESTAAPIPPYGGGTRPGRNTANEAPSPL